MSKPISVHKLDAERLIAAHTNPKQVFAAMFNQRTDPHYIRVKKLIEDGELGAMMVRRLGGEVIRGSSSHTGARALRDYYQALAHDGVSPAITPDGPEGPPWRFKPGAVLLAQMSQRPIIPMAYAASRAWKIQWDRFVIPKPLSRVAIAVGEPVYVPKGLDARGLEKHQADMEIRLKSLYEQAKAALG